MSLSIYQTHFWSCCCYSIFLHVLYCVQFYFESDILFCYYFSSYLSTFGHTYSHTHTHKMYKHSFDNNIRKEVIRVIYQVTVCNLSQPFKKFFFLSCFCASKNRCLSLEGKCVSKVYRYKLLTFCKLLAKVIASLCVYVFAPCDVCNRNNNNIDNDFRINN